MKNQNHPNLVQLHEYSRHDSCTLGSRGLKNKKIKQKQTQRVILATNNTWKKKQLLHPIRHTPGEKESSQQNNNKKNSRLMHPVLILYY